MVLLLLGRVQKSSQSRKQPASQPALLFGEEMCISKVHKSRLQRNVLVFIHLVHCETAAHFVVISSILNDEVGKLTGEHCVHD